MKIEFEIEDAVAESVRRLLEVEVPRSRQKFIDKVAAEVLSRTADGNPVRTGRSRAAWEVAASQLSLSTAGTASRQVNTSEECQAEVAHDAETTLVTVTNSVPYIAHLEYGTANMSPFAMLRGSLAAVRGRIGSWFQLRSTPSH